MLFVPTARDIKKRLQNKLSDKCIEKLNQKPRFIKLLDMVNSIQE